MRCYLFLLLYICATTAQENTELDKLLNLPIEELLNINVTIASKTQETLLETPSSVVVFTKADIRRLGILYLEELFHYVPGFQVTKDAEQGHGFRISSRGRSTALSESILFLRDGKRLNDVYTGGVSIINRYISIHNVKQVEIIRGPGSALYGSNAFLGVVNIISDKSNEVALSIGTQNHRKLHINMYHQEDDIDLSASVYGFSSEGEHYSQVTDIWGRTQPTSDPIKGYNGSFSASYKRLSFDLHFMERYLNGFLPFGTLSEFANKEFTSQQSYSLKYSSPKEQNLSYSILTFYKNEHWETTALGIPKGIELAPGFRLEQDVFVGPFLTSFHSALQFDLSYKYKDLQFSGGTSFSFSGISDVANLFSHNPRTLEYEGGVKKHTSDTTNFNEETSRRTIGAYLQTKYTLLPSVKLTLGLRFDHYNDFGNSINPRMAFIYLTPFKGSFKMMYGKAFRAPNFLELYDKNNPVDFGNPALDAETIQTAELSYTQVLKHLSFTTTYFKNYFSKSITFGQSIAHPNNPFNSPSFVNDSSTYTFSGIELNTVFSILSHTQIQTSISYNFNNHPDISRHVHSFGINYSLHPFNLNISGRYKSETTGIKQPDYWIFNAHMKYSVNPHILLSATIKNIFNTHYFTPTTLAIPNGIPNAGRTFNLNTHYHF